MTNKWDMSRLMAARDLHEDWLLRQPSVMGVGIGDNDHGQLCVKILIDHADAKVRSEIESELQGIPIYFEQTGPIEAF